MASGSFTAQVGNRSSSQNEYIQVWWSSSPDPANNRSLVTAYAKMYRPWYLAVDYNQNIEMWINGTYFSATRYGWRGRGWTEAYISGSVWVPHNGDGTKTVSIRVNTQVKAWLRNWVGWVDTGYHSCRLDNLARKSSFTISPSTGASLGDTLKVNLSRSSSSVRHSITFKAGDYTEEILKRANDNGSTSTYNYALSADKLLSHLSSQTTTASVTLNTFNGSTSLGTSSVNFPLRLKDGVHAPTLPESNGITIEPVPIAPNTSTSEFVQGKSKAKITFAPTTTAGDSGAIKTYYATLNGRTISSASNIITTDELMVTGTNTLEAYVIDRRNMKSNVVTKTFTVLPYYLPKITNFTAVRCLENGTNNASGTYVKFSFDYDIADCDGNNSATINLGQRNSINSNAYTNKYTWDIALPTDQHSGTITEILGTYSVDESFDFELVAEDMYGAISKTYIDIGTEELLIDMSQNGVALGKVVERENAFEVNWDSYFEGTIYGTVQAHTSDARKKDLVDEDLSALLDIWDELNVVLFKYKKGDDKVQAGLIAQEVMKIFNEHNLDWNDYGIIYMDEATGYYSLNYEFINQLTMAKVKILENQIADIINKLDNTN